MNTSRAKTCAAFALFLILTACSSSSPTVTLVPTLAPHPTVSEIELTNEAILATNAAVRTAVIGTDTAVAGQTATALDILACATAPPAQTPEPPHTPTVSSLPDLIINGMAIPVEAGGACNYTSTQLGVCVSFQNVGGVDAGPFVVEVNGVQQAVSGLGAGQKDFLWFPGYTEESTAFVDATFQVAESDENNNQLSQHVPIPTLLPTYTPATEMPEALVVEVVDGDTIEVEINTQAQSSKQKGITYTTWQPREYTQPYADLSLANLVATGADWIALTVSGYQNTITSTIIFTTAATPTDAELTHVISEAHKLGLKVMLKPHVDLLNDPGHWRGQIGDEFTTELLLPNRAEPISARRKVR